jgi:hypothetical protein
MVFFSKKGALKGVAGIYAILHTVSGRLDCSSNNIGRSLMATSMEWFIAPPLGGFLIFKTLELYSPVGGPGYRHLQWR